MGRVLSGRDVVKGLAKVGFRVVAQRGSHLRLNGEVEGRRRVVIVPDHKEITPGTLASIIRQTGLGREQFVSLMT